MKGKTVFTKAEASQIITLIARKIVSNTNEQKKITKQIRALGFYSSDFGIGGGYNELDFLRAVSVIGSDFDGGLICSTQESQKVLSKKSSPKARLQSDEAYILDLCDETLDQKGLRQHRFDFLKGDTGTSLPVDIYYPELNLVIEYRERQHTEEVKFFDKKITASCITRGDQRRKYDEARRKILPLNGIKLIEIGFDEFEHTKTKRLIRNRAADILVIHKKLQQLQ